MTARSTGDARSATIYDVARHAGVSHQTVSRVLRGLSGVGPATRERVQAALAELHYRPSIAARELARSRARRIGVVGYETFQSSTSKVLAGADEVATAAGYLLDIVTVDPLGEVDDIVRQLAAINGSDVAGLLATSPTVNVREAFSRSSFRMPVFFDVDGDRDSAPGPYLGTSLAARQVMEHLLDLGHRRIAHVAGPLGWDSAAQREAVYRIALAQRGLEELPIARGDWSAASGYLAGRRLLEARATAVFVANDRMALGVLRAFAEQGIRVPEDVSVAGIDDIPEAAYFHPPLTTVHMDFEEDGRVAARSLIGLIEDPAASPPPYPRSALTVRSSTAAPV